MSSQVRLWFGNERLLWRVCRCRQVLTSVNDQRATRLQWAAIVLYLMQTIARVRACGVGVSCVVAAVDSTTRRDSLLMVPHCLTPTRLPACLCDTGVTAGVRGQGLLLLVVECVGRDVADSGCVAGSGWRTRLGTTLVCQRGDVVGVCVSVCMRQCVPLHALTDVRVRVG